MANGPVGALAQVAAEPGHALAADDVVGVDLLVQVGDIGDVAADDDLGVGLVVADQLAHLLHLGLVGNDRGDADHVVLVVADFVEEAVQRGEVQERAGGFDVGLDEHDAPTAVEHPQRERALGPRHLVMIKLHRIHHPAAVLVVLGIGAEDARQEHAGLRAGRMNDVRVGGGCFKLGGFNVHYQTISCENPSWLPVDSDPDYRHYKIRRHGENGYCVSVW